MEIPSVLVWATLYVCWFYAFLLALTCLAFPVNYLCGFATLTPWIVYRIKNYNARAKAERQSHDLDVFNSGLSSAALDRILREMAKTKKH